MKRILCTLFLFLNMSAVASATAISFNARPAWLSYAAINGLQTNTPLNLAPLVTTGDSIVVPQVSGGGVVLTPVGGTQLVVADRDAAGYDFGVPQVISAQLGFPSALRFDLIPGIFGVGFDVGAFPAFGEITDLNVLIVTAGATQTFDFAGLGGPSLSFVGFIGEAQILSVVVSGGPIDPVFANITTVGVPEPSTGLLVAGATAFVLLWRRRRN